MMIKFGGKWMRVTELTFKENILCLLCGTLSIYLSLIAKIILPK
jgi:hypothetical protein